MARCEGAVRLFDYRRIRNRGRIARGPLGSDRSLLPPRWPKTFLTVVVAAVGSFSWLGAGALFTATPASAATVTAPAITQCDQPDFPITAGKQVTCTVTVVNNTTSTGATSSTVTTSACLGAAGVPFPSCPLNLGPVTNTTSSTQLVTSVDQCNGIVTAGGSNVICNVTILNNVPAGTSTSGVTVDQCIGSATGGGSTQVCVPSGSTTNATVTQCNGSATGGGTYAGQPAVGCTVTGAASALPVTVNQCNNTATGGGSAVTCMSTFTNNFVTPTSTTTTTVGSTAAPAAGSKPGVGGTTGGGAAAGAGGSGAGAAGSGGAKGTGSGLATVAGVVPTGAPQTGLGGASRSTSPDFMYVGSVALAAAGLTMVLAIRRRRGSMKEFRQNHVR